jgi:hypothetical protein
MRGAIMASGARPRSAVELFIERLVPFEQRPPAGRAADPIRLVRLPSRRAHQEALEPQHGPTSFGSLHVLDTQQRCGHRSRRRGRARVATSSSPIRGREPGSQHGASTPGPWWLTAEANDACRRPSAAASAGWAEQVCELLPRERVERHQDNLHRRFNLACTAVKL